jgi:hypothetical protein
LSYRKRPAGHTAGLFSFHIKGKAIEKVTAVKPQCPKGYKKK